MHKRVLFYILLSMAFMPLWGQKSPAAKPFTVVIDAGHGGKDPGAVGKTAREKDLNLSVSLRAGRLIEKAYPEVRVLYTRKTDEFITLQGRADFVNKNNADLFICVHTNSAENKAVKGAETFVLGTEKMEQNLDVAMRENAVIKMESDYKTQYQGFDPNSIDSYIMFELMQNRYMDQSLRFAELMQHQFVDSLHRVDRGVRQAAFWVLLKSACPSVLVEIGFVSNPEEEKYLASTKGLDEISESIYRAFCAFYKPAQPEPQAPEPKPQISEPAEPKPQVSEPAQPKPTVAEPEPQAPLWAVQIAARRQPLPEGSSVLQGLRCSCLQRDGWYKYYYGESTDKEAVRQTMMELRVQFPDCFMIKL